MIRHSWLRLSRGTTLAIALSLSYGTCLVNAIHAQSVEPTRADGFPFQVAPSFPLKGAPNSVAIGDLNQDGKPDLVTTDYLSGNVTVFLGTGDGKFAPGVDYPAGSHPGSVKIADIDGDGRPDIIVLNQTEGTVSVLLGSGDGKLQQPKSYPAGEAPSLLAVGDFNGDGKVDLAVAAGYGKYVAVLLNDGKGHLEAPILVSIHKTPASLAVADINNDGKADLALANADGTVTVLLGKGHASFRPLPDIAASSGALSSIVAGDFDRDGNIDLAVTDSTRNMLSVVMGKGDGSFAPSVAYSVGEIPAFAAVADVDGDGVPDLAIVNQGSNTFSVLRGNGDGTFRPAQDFVVGNSPLAAVAGDFDGDGHVDLAIINYSSQTISVPLGNGDGTFKAARSYTTDLVPRAIASGDLNGDKLPDLVVANYCGTDSLCGKTGTVAIFLADESGGYRLSNTYALGAGPVSVALVDANGDKNLDIIALNRGDKTISVLLGDGNGSFQQPFTFSTADSPVAVAVGDFNKDGEPDLAVVGDCGSAKCTRPGNVELFLGTGDGSFSSGLTHPVGYAPSSVAVGDINKDGNLDILVANGCGKDATCKTPGTATVLIGDGKGNFKPAVDIPLGNTPSSIALADLSGRGVPDLLVSLSADNTLAVLRGNGDASFQKPVVYPVGYSPSSLAVADFNGDGKPDIAVANANDSTTSVLYGNGDGSLQTAFSLPVGAGPQALAAVEGATAGHASLVTANGNSSAASPSGATNAESQVPTVAETNSAQPNLAAAGVSPSTPGSEITVLANVIPAAATVTPTIGVTGGAANPGYGTSLVFTATVTGTSGATQPTGTVIFNDALDSSTLVCDTPTDLTLVQHGTVNSTAFCTISTLPVTAAGSPHLITATYVPGPDPNYSAVGPSTPALSQTVNKVAPSTFTVARTTGGTPSTYGTQLVFTATVSGPSGVLAPTGTVTFTDAGTSINASCGTNPGVLPTASCTIANLAASTTAHTIAATYPGDANYMKATSSNTVSQTVNPAPTTVALSPGNGSLAVNQSVTFKATITANLPGTISPGANDGTVTFKSLNSAATPTSTTLCASVKLDASGSASCPVTSLPMGTNTVTASYSGDSSFAGSSMTSVQFVNAGSTTVTITPPSAASSVNGSVMVAATVAQTLPPGDTAPPPSGGTVAFSLTPTGSMISIPLCTAKLTSGTASCTVNPLAISADTYSIMATYSGDATLNGSQAITPFPTLTVKKATPMVTVAAATIIPSPPVVNQQLKFTAAFTGIPSGGITPVGNFTFKTTLNGTTTTIPECASIPVATPTCITTSLAQGSNSISAVYNGDTNFISNTGSLTPPLSVGFGNTTTTVTSPGTGTSVVNQAVTFTATVAQTPTPGVISILPAGTVAFSTALNGGPSTPLAGCGKVSVASSVVSGVVTTVATCTPTSPLILGSNSVTAVYTPDKNFNPSNNNTTPFPQTVGPGSTTVSLTPTSGESNVNDEVTFTATVSQKPPATGSLTGLIPLTGAVTFSSGAKNVPGCLSPIPVDKGVAKCSTQMLQAITYPVTATYNVSGSDTNFKSSASNISPQTVSPTSVTVALPTSLATITATQSGVYTVNVTPTPPAPGSAVPGPVLPSGTVTVSAVSGVDGSVTSCTGAIPQTMTPSSTYTTSCSIPFPNGGSTPFQVSASYAETGTVKNYSPGATPTSVPQIVQDFSLSPPSTSPASQGIVYVTQGYTVGGGGSNPDPVFTSALAASANTFPMPGLTGTLTYGSCTLRPPAGQTGSLPTCNLGSTTGPVPGTVSVSLTSSSTTSAGNYTATFSGTDESAPFTPTVPGPKRSVSFIVTVVPLDATLNLSSGASGTASAIFAVTQGDDMYEFGCNIYDSKGTLVTTGIISCIHPPNGPIPQGGSVSYTIGAPLVAGATFPTPRPAATAIVAATFFGVPLFALAGWLRRGKSPKRNFLRFLGFLVLVVGLSQAIGCGSGGGFTPPQRRTSANGSYFVQATATDKSVTPNVTYYSVIPVVVN